MKFQEQKQKCDFPQLLANVNEDYCLIFFCEIRGKDITMVAFIRHLWDICSQGENTTICNIMERSSAWCSYCTHFYKVVELLKKGFSPTKFFVFFLKNLFWPGKRRPARPRPDRWARIQFCGVFNQQNYGNQPKTMKPP